MGGSGAGESATALVRIDADATSVFSRAISRDPTDDVISAIDLVRWLNGLSGEDRGMLELRAAGCTLEETGEKMGVSTSAGFARCRELGAELAERMGVTIGRRAVSPVPAERDPRAGLATCGSPAPARLTG